MASQLLLSFTPTRASLHLIGEFDLAQRRALRRRLVEALALCGPELEVDTSKVTFVDCGTLWELERAHQELRHRGGRLTVRLASPIFRRVALLADYPELVPAASETGPREHRVVTVVPEPGRRRRRLHR
jgi:anti-anti-sigma regulatory factor